ncbi:hypothetical protein FBQ97_08315 [Acidobacteria bacterium ACD]|nr:MAG: hypothetical protein EDX89_01840 [Acidobacteriota bacterium]MCE7957458.1 hypothetical protein [Acidobacteria bacterium ACB2]MDL1949799.1 hypothetical protein [Acidobacteria bacterium ACD]
MKARACLALLFPALLVLPAAAAAPEKTVVKSYPLAPGGVVSVEAYKGSIRIATWEKAEVSVKARVVPDEPCADDAEKVERTEVDVEASPGRVSIRSDYDRVKRDGDWFSGWFGSCSSLPFVHYEITLPRSAEVRVKDFKSTIEVAGLDGDLELETYKGTVDVRGLSGALDLETYKGEARVETAMKKDVRMETYKGDLVVLVPKGAGLVLDVDPGRKGRFSSGLDVTAASRHEDDRVRETVGGGGALLRMETFKGELRVQAK